MVIKEDQRLWFTSFLIKSKEGGITNESNYQLANELYKPIKKSKKKNVFFI